MTISLAQLVLWVMEKVTPMESSLILTLLLLKRNCLQMLMMNLQIFNCNC